MGLKEKLKHIPMFSEFSGEELSTLANLMEEVEFEDGTVIFSEKAPSKDLFFILDGRVNIYKILFGTANFLTILEKNDLFGEVGFVDEMARSASASAVGKTSLVRFTHEHFDVIGDQNPKLGMKFLFQLMKELSRKFRAVNEGGDVKAPEQTISELIISGQQVKIDTEDTEYVCKIIYADKNPTNPMLKIEIKGSSKLLPLSHIRSITLPNKFGKFA